MPLAINGTVCHFANARQDAVTFALVAIFYAERCTPGRGSAHTSSTPGGIKQAHRTHRSGRWSSQMAIMQYLPRPKKRLRCASPKVHR